jgi:hydroxyacylglutathione hydrolase
MIFRQIRSGGDRNFAYLIASEKTGACSIIDPSPDASCVLKIVKEEGFEIKSLFNTHLHYDHSEGNTSIKKFVGTDEIKYVNCDNLTLIKNDTRITIDTFEFEIMYTPGHTSDSICIKVGNKLMTGDTLFVGKIGGTYSREDSMAELGSLKKIVSLPVDTEVWPGHDYGVMPSSTIGYEIENNPFLKRLGNFDEFFRLKNNWTQYKLEHHIK